MKIFAIVVTFNGENWIRKCLGSLLESTVPLHLIVVDNKSIDKTVEIIENDYKSVHLIKSERNLGFGQGNNIGLRIALVKNADYVFLLNQDAWIEPDTIQKLIEVHRKNKEYAIISPLHIDGKGDLEWHFSTYIQPENCPNLVSDFFLFKLKNIYETNFVNAAAWMMSRECIIKVGGFDPLFPHYGEDNDYASRVYFKGLKVGVCPNIKIIHDITYKSQKQIKLNKYFQLIFAFGELKNLNSKYYVSVILYIKKNIDLLTTLLISFQIKYFRFRFSVFFKTLFFLRKIYLSRKKSKLETAFLDLN